jgi:CDP-6-deoxy-D-xylo-4-hexulose-3-dehydrase
MNYNNISLVKDTIDLNDIEKLIEWLKTNPKLTKGDLTVNFERIWSDWLGCKYSVFLNSGSSANLAMIYSLILSGRLKNNNIVVPAVSWVTTVTPAIQLGLNPIMCDCDKENLGLVIFHLEKLIIEHKPSCLILVHVLGIPNNMKKITELCLKHNVLILEDTCESIGSTINEKKLGTLGLMSSFSFYFGHHISTIEGGMVCTNDEEIYHILLSIRSHGWDRDLPDKEKTRLRDLYKVDTFRSLYTFYYPGFNLRSTDLQAFLGIQQMNKLDNIVSVRNKNYLLYNKYIDDSLWKIKSPENSFVSNFAYPLITEKIGFVVKNLQKNNIECRPLICGSMAEQPFWINKYGYESLPNSKKVHDFGLYLPNNHQMGEKEIILISDVVNKSINNKK